MEFDMVIMDELEDRVLVLNPCLHTIIGPGNVPIGWMYHGETLTAEQVVERGLVQCVRFTTKEAQTDD